MEITTRPEILSNHKGKHDMSYHSLAFIFVKNKRHWMILHFMFAFIIWSNFRPSCDFHCITLFCGQISFLGPHFYVLITSPPIFTPNFPWSLNNPRHYRGSILFYIQNIYSFQYGHVYLKYIDLWICILYSVNAGFPFFQWRHWSVIGYRSMMSLLWEELSFPFHLGLNRVGP